MASWFQLCLEVKKGRKASIFSAWQTVALVLLVVQGGQSSTKEEEYDPWKESDRPKVVVDYHGGPLRGKTL